MTLLSAADLEVSFPKPGGGWAKAVDGVSLRLERGERLGVVGESGAGKSMLAFSLINLISAPGRITGGALMFDGEDLTRATAARMRAIRGDRISMIFQDPMTTLNPVLTIERQMIETLQAHGPITADRARTRALAALNAVAVPSAETRLRGYPHELSGGLRQRVVIAIALLTEPDIIIADEPTTALDVTVQAEIMALLTSLCGDRTMAMILITHDLALVSESTERLMVMYSGQVVEEGATADIIAQPSHPYTCGLLEALPQRAKRGAPLAVIPGSMPSIGETPKGCPFHPRCPRAHARCLAERPHSHPVEPELARPGQSRAAEPRHVACFNPVTRDEYEGAGE